MHDDPSGKKFKADGVVDFLALEHSLQAFLWKHSSQKADRFGGNGLGIVKFFSLSLVI